MHKVLFVDTTNRVLEERLSRAGLICDSFESKNLDEFIDFVPDYTGIIIRSKFRITKEVIDNAVKLKFIGRVGSGMENIDVEYAETKGIFCLNSPEGSRDAVGEHTIGLLLSLFNKIAVADPQVRNAMWYREANRGLEIKDKTVGIIGYGNMGSAFAEKLCGFGANVIAYDKYKSGFGNHLVKEVNYDTIFRETDILSLHVPLTEETNYLVDNDYLNSFDKNIFLINTSRGKVVNTSDLVSNLESGKIKGAALDVLEFEMTSFEDLDASTLPESFRYLAASNKVVLTPHVAGWTIESDYKLSKVLADKIIAIMGY